MKSSATSPKDLDLQEKISRVAASVTRSLEGRCTELNNLNVFPVPDGDTGTNLLHTWRGVAGEIERLGGNIALRGSELTKAALLAAKGNSGIILAQIIGGMAGSLRDSSLSPQSIATAFKEAQEAAYKAVRQPVEGTILTVIREMAEAAQEGVREYKDDLQGFLEHLYRVGEESVNRTPELLPVLKQAGVVDSGAKGLMTVMRGVLGGLYGGHYNEEQAVGAGADLSHLEEIDDDPIHHYCTNFLITGTFDAGALESQLDEFGASIVVVSQDRLCKVHLHTHEPGRALALATALGEVEGVQIDNIYSQRTSAQAERQAAGGLPGDIPQAEGIQREDDKEEAAPTSALPAENEPPWPQTALVAVVAGLGNQNLFKSMGAGEIVSGGQSMNPSTGDLVEAIERARGHEVVLLPNNKNVLLAAEQARSMTPKPVMVVGTTSIAQGLACTVAFDEELNAGENASEMELALRDTQSGEIVLAARDAQVGDHDIKQGNFLVMHNDSLATVSEDFFKALVDLAVELVTKDSEILTLLGGTGRVPGQLEEGARHLGALFPEIEIEIHEGGQPGSIVEILAQ